MGETWLPIRYREFWDVPRSFLVRFRGRLFLFESLFDDALDDYPPRYKVHLMPDLAEDELKGSWEHLSRRSVGWLGEVPVQSVKFDPTLRREIHADIFGSLQT